MVKVTRKIKVEPGSELAQLLESAGAIPLILDKDGELYRLDRWEQEQTNLWEGYDPVRVREALRKSAGTLAGVDTTALIRDIHEGRAQDTIGRPAE